MTPSGGLYPLLQGLNKTDYNINNLDDEVRVDTLCKGLLRHLYQELTQRSKVDLVKAGEFCHGADYFLREFIIADRHENLFAIDANRVRQFAGHWYIIRTTEPNLKELQGILTGTAQFYQFLARQGLVTELAADKITSQCREFDYYQERINDFWAIEGDGYNRWRQTCPLEPVAEQP